MTLRVNINVRGVVLSGTIKIKSVSDFKKQKSDELKQIFINVIKKQLGDDSNVGLMLSGGIDSASILYALFELDVNVHPYTFYLEGYESNDLISSQKLADKYDLDLTIVEIPTDTILSDFKKLYQYGCYKKTHFETKIHYLHLSSKVKESLLFYGVNADYWYGLIMNMVVNGRDNPQKFNMLREKRWGEHHSTEYKLDKIIMNQYNKIKLIDPYACKEVYDYFMQFDWEFLNKPYSKWMIVEAFKEYFVNDGCRKHSNFQIESGMREHCKKFVDDPNINVNNKKSPVGVYNDLMKKWSVEDEYQTLI